MYWRRKTLPGLRWRLETDWHSSKVTVLLLTSCFSPPFVRELWRRE
jgi:hypothetical protein